MALLKKDLTVISAGLKVMNAVAKRFDAGTGIFHMNSKKILFQTAGTGFNSMKIVLSFSLDGAANRFGFLHRNLFTG